MRLKIIISGCFLWLIALVIICSPRPGYSFKIVDSVGDSHFFDKAAARIISLYPAHTENLAELGASRALIGISTSDSYPESILSKPKFSYHDSVEKFIMADPDCILIRPMISRSNPNLISKLREYGIKVVSLQPTTAEELYHYWQALGEISGFGSAAAEMIEQFKLNLGSIANQIADIPFETRPRVYFESIHSRMRTFSPESISIFCLTSAGGVNVAADAVSRRGTNIAGYSKERILAKAEDIDIYLAQSGRMNRITVDEIINEPGFGAIKAVRNGRVYLIDEHLVSRPTPRLLLGIKTLQHLLYPG